MPMSEKAKNFREDFRKYINRDLTKESIDTYFDGKNRRVYNEEYIGKTGMAGRKSKKEDYEPEI